jgi:hypothetical protein
VHADPGSGAASISSTYASTHLGSVTAQQQGYQHPQQARGLQSSAAASKHSSVAAKMQNSSIAASLPKNFMTHLG